MNTSPRRIAAAVALAATIATSWNAQASIAQDAAAGLSDTEWHLVSIGNTAVTGSDPQLRLAADGTVGGSTGCNMMRAGYTSDGGSLEFGPIGTTRKFCHGAWETERAFLSMLEDVRGYTISGGTLTLTGGNGEVLAEFNSTAN